MIYFRQNLRSILAIFVFISLIICSSAYGGAVQIKDIEMGEKGLKVDIDGPFDNYRVYKPYPFKVVLEIDGVGIGRFKERLMPEKGIMSEISLFEMKEPNIGVHLEILLSYPSNIRAERVGNAILISVDSKALDDKKEVQKAGEIVAVVFDKTDETVDLIVKGDGPMPEPDVIALDGKVLIDIPNVSMRASMPSRIPPPVKNIKYETRKDGIRLILDIHGKVENEVSTFDDEIVISFLSNKKISLAENRGSKNSETKNQDTIQNLKRSNLVSMDFQDADVVPVLRLLADVSGYNIVVHPDVKGKITLKLMNVPWQQALDVVTKTFNLEKIVEGNVIRVIPRKLFEEEMKSIAEAEIAKETAHAETRIFVVNYADVEKAKESIEKAGIIKKDNISIDKRTRSIIIKDTQANLKAVEELIEKIDKPTSQVLIEARIVEMSSTFTRELGVQWGFEWLSSNLRTSLGGSVDSPGSQTGLSSTRPNVTGGQFPVAINLPAKDATSAITFGYLNAAQTFGLDLRLSAFQDIGKSKVLSNPRIITADNQKAQIILGESVPYGEREVSGNQVTISTKFKDVAIIIEVIPQITTDDVISLNVNTKKEDLRRFVDIGQGTLAPHTDKVEAATSVLIKNGETMVIGGILKKKESDSTSGVPGLMNIPILGWLFKKKAVDESNTEVLIFITPRIIKGS
jgi:type IV pilus assembly protein PilQ